MLKPSGLLLHELSRTTPRHSITPSTQFIELHPPKTDPNTPDIELSWPNPPSFKDTATTATAAATTVMAPSTKVDKLVLSVIATVISFVALGLITAGSFVPRWARPLNVSSSDANITFSLWGREDCYGVICSTILRKEFVLEKRYYFDDSGKKHEREEFKEEIVPIVTCVEANYCNITWLGDVEFMSVPSLLYVARAFTIPAMIAGLMTVLLYLLKVILLVVRPLWRRIYVKAAYLTFAAISGLSAGIAVIIFCTMLEKEEFELLWAPALTGSGGGLFLFIGVGGYLSWRNKASMEEWDTQSEWSERTSNVYEFNSREKEKEKGRGKGYLRSMSSASNKSDFL